MNKKLWLSLPLILLVFVICFYYSEICLAEGSSVKILEIEPISSVVLKSGSEVHFKVKLEYSVVDDSATVNLIIQNAEYSGGVDAVIGSTMQVLTKGNGTVILEKTVTVPDTNALQIFTPLMIPGKTRTSIVDMKAYKVIK